MLYYKLPNNKYSFDRSKGMPNLIHHFCRGRPMSLFITSVDQYGYVRYFHCHCDSLELALDVVSAISVLGSLVLRVDLVDNNQWIQLPVEVFDGECFSGPLNKLEREWQQILGGPGHTEAIESVPAGS